VSGRSRTPSQTVGPFFGFALPYDRGPELLPQWHPSAITVRGQVLDGAREPVPDALVELWQPDSAGRMAAAAGSLAAGHLDFCGFGRCGTDSEGGYWFSTVKPGPVGASAPYGAVLVFARGLLRAVATRIYFPEDADAHQSDPVLARVDRRRRPTLVAVRTGDRSYRFDVRLQGENETVFFAPHSSQ
jgi:protocatechuate 3,4-dioxygenase, alpha subunit